MVAGVSEREEVNVEPWLDDGDVRLYHGDCLEVLRQLPDRSVHMCATSPPFYGLRDYGTGMWEGGDPHHTHDRTGARGGRGGSGAPGKNTVGATPATVPVPACSCGARYIDPQIGLEDTPDQWVARLVDVFREVRRVLRDDGTLWVEIGDSYHGGGYSNHDINGPDWKAEMNGDKRRSRQQDLKRANPQLKPKDLVGQPWMLAFALRADGWYLRSEIIWSRPNPMPESVTDRPTKAHSTIFLLSKSARYFYDADAIREPYQPDGRKVTTVKGTDASAQHRDGERWPNPAGANARSVWSVPTEPTPFAHFATWPQKLVARMVRAGTSEKGCCPECGAPWTRVTEDAHDAEGRTTNGQKPRTSERRGFDVRMVKTTETLGWQPSCDCESTDPVPCVVLDPFMGSGTTALVARNLGRHSVGIELNEEYLQIAAEHRLAQQSLLTGADW